MKLEQRIHALLDSDAAATLAGIRRGIEKESLRISTDGTLAQTPHPAALGSALTHPYITTDYSEALLEFITPPSTELHKPLEFLEQLHRYVYSHIGDEVLWVNSMPCMIRNDADVPVAQYGSSNVGRMKSVYREGLGHRYGRKMQTIAGIHYNFSYPEEFWKLNQVLEGESGPLQDYISKRYFDLTRNFQRYSWLLVYLFGASPALCKSFLAGREHQLDTFDHTLFKPNATSLRMSDLGYQNNAQSLGRLLLLARRLCESGCRFVTVATRFVWDMHGDQNNLGVERGMEAVGRPFNRAVSAFIEDCESRGLSDDILLVCTGEMGRTPKINNRGGRDHWGRLTPLMLYGGGITAGQVIGKSERDGSQPAIDPYNSDHLVSTILHTLFDMGQLRVEQGLPVELTRMISDGTPIAGLH